MIMGRMTLSARRAGRASMLAKWAGCFFVASVGIGISSCQNTDDLLAPGEVAIGRMTAVFVPDSVLTENPIDLNGEVLEREWGGSRDTELPFVQIRMSKEDGQGNPGEVKYISAKCIYSTTDIYFLFRWTDDEASIMKDALYYVGPINDGCADLIVDPANWSFENPLDPRALPDEEDRLDILFEVPEGSGPVGKEDAWQWQSTKTNPVRDMYDRLVDSASFPARGTPGYLEDGVLDPDFGFFFDPGTPTWRQNWTGDSPLPNFVYRSEDDPFVDHPNPTNCFNDFGEECRFNNGIDFYYIWRDDLRLPVDEFFFCDSLNQSVLPQGNEPRPWLFGDAISGYWYTYGSGSRSDVRGKGVFDDGIWTLEIGRKMFTEDLANDVNFRRVVREDNVDVDVYVEELSYKLRLYDNSTDEYWGSGPQTLLLGPREGGK